jgi:hypothetical protein
MLISEIFIVLRKNVCFFLCGFLSRCLTGTEPIVQMGKSDTVSLEDWQIRGTQIRMESGAGFHSD